MISQSSFDKLTKDDRVPAVIEEAKLLSSNFCFSSFLALLSLSSVIGMTMESYYPMICENPNDVYELLFNCSVQPRPGVTLDSKGRTIHIFRCASMPCDYITTRKVPDKKDHYVPLLSKQRESHEYCLPTSFSLTYYISPLLSLKKAPASPAQPIKRKQKQLTVLHHFPSKSRKLDPFLQESCSLTAHSNTVSSAIFPVTSSFNSTISEPSLLTSKHDVIPEMKSFSFQDIGLHYQKVNYLSDEDKYLFLTNSSKPQLDFHYPTNSVTYVGRTLQKDKWCATC